MCVCGCMRACLSSLWVFACAMLKGGLCCRPRMLMSISMANSSPLFQAQVLQSCHTAAEGSLQGCQRWSPWRSACSLCFWSTRSSSSTARSNCSAPSTSEARRSLQAARTALTGRARAPRAPAASSPPAPPACLACLCPSSPPALPHPALQAHSRPQLGLARLAPLRVPAGCPLPGRARLCSPARHSSD